MISEIEERLKEAEDAKQSLYSDPRVSVNDYIKHITFLQAEIGRLEKVNEWISIKDQLPPPDEFVLAFEKVAKEDRGSCEIDANFKDEDKYPIITHWKPLPEAPSHE